MIMSNLIGLIEKSRHLNIYKNTIEILFINVNSRLNSQTF